MIDNKSTFDAFLGMIALIMGVVLFAIAFYWVCQVIIALYTFSTVLFWIAYLVIFFSIVFYLVRKQKHAS